MFLRQQKLKTLEWADERTDSICYKFAMHERMEILEGAQLVVREGQAALFIKDGQLVQAFAPGRHDLTEKYDVYFVNTMVFRAQKWGTAIPFNMSDPEFGNIMVRGFGSYDFKVTCPEVLIIEMLDQRNEFTVANLKEKLRSLITGNIGDIIARSKFGVKELSSKIKDFNAFAREELQSKFNNLGLELTSFVADNFTFPENVERALSA